MKWIKFERIQGQQNVGTQENPVMEDILLPVELSYCEYNLEIAKAEAYKGEYTIEDDGQPEPEQMETTDDVLNALLGVE